jgi:hypothetical protein
MTELKQVNFTETVCVAKATAFNGSSALSHYAGNIKGTNGSCSTIVNIMLFNTNSKDGIVNLIKDERTVLKNAIVKEKDEKKSKTLTEHLAYFSKLLQEVTDPLLVKEMPKELESCLHKERILISSEEAIFISGVTDIVEK